MTESRDEIVDSIRSRILRGLEAGTLAAGDRLPSGRDLAAEFATDHRVVLAAYRKLAGEQLVQLTPRGGIYVAARGAGGGGVPPLPESWFVDVLTQGLAREIPAPELHEWLRRSTETLRLRAVVVTSTEDQGFGLCRELRDDFGLESDSVLPSELDQGLPLPVRRADILVTTSGHSARIQAIGADLKKKVIVIEVRPDLVTGEWSLLLRQPLYAVVATAEFGAMLRKFFENVEGIENLRIIVLGTDELSQIPPDAPTYITQRVRASLAGTQVPGRILPTARTIAASSAREIFAFMVESNVEAMRRVDRDGV